MKDHVMIALRNSWSNTITFVLNVKRDPNHSYLRRNFRDLFVRDGFDYDHVNNYIVGPFSNI